MFTLKIVDHLKKLNHQHSKSYIQHDRRSYLTSTQGVSHKSIVAQQSSHSATRTLISRNALISSVHWLPGSPIDHHPVSLAIRRSGSQSSPCSGLLGREVQSLATVHLSSQLLREVLVADEQRRKLRNLCDEVLAEEVV